MYFGPETYLPLASVAAGLTGIVLMFWRRVQGVFRRFYLWCAGAWRNRRRGRR